MRAHTYQRQPKMENINPRFFPRELAQCMRNKVA